MDVASASEGADVGEEVYTFDSDDGEGDEEGVDHDDDAEEENESNSAVTDKRNDVLLPIQSIPFDPLTESSLPPFCTNCLFGTKKSCTIFCIFFLGSLGSLLEPADASGMADVAIAVVINWS